MLTPNEIESIPLLLQKYYKDLEYRIMLDIVRRLKENDGEITSSADWQIKRLYELGKSKKEIKGYIRQALNYCDEEIDRIYSDVLCEGYTRDKALYDMTGDDFIPFEENKELQQITRAITKQTKDECKNITDSLGFAIEKNGKIEFTPLADYYQKTLDNAAMDIVSGAFDYNTVINRTVAEMTKSGLRTVDYASGWSNRVDVASRRAIMTGFNQIVAKVNEENAEKLHTNFFEVSYHNGARPTHQVWQGRVYSKEQLVSVCGLGDVTGLCGANCYHSYSPFIPGASVRNYTDEELDKMNAEENIPKEYNGKYYTTYEALQRQRRLETAMRAQRQKIKLLQEGGTDENDIISAKAKYNGMSDEYARFSKAMGLPEQRERITIDGLRNIGQLSKVENAIKNPVEKIKLDDIIKLSDDEIKNIIKLDEINKSIIIGKQGKHLLNHNNYIEDRSYVTVSIEEIQTLVNKHAGTGTLLRTKNGNWKKQEIIICDHSIGYDVDNITKQKHLTSGFKIHYSDKGVHIVPKRSE